MSDRTQDLKNLRAVATACKNYVDETKEQILWQVGQYNITTQDDNTTAYQKTVPTGATRVKIKSIGGMSYKSENLIVLSDVAETTTNGITYKVSNGVITLNGNCDDDNTFISIPLSQHITFNGNYGMSLFNNSANTTVGGVRLATLDGATIEEWTGSSITSANYSKTVNNTSGNIANRIIIRCYSSTSFNNWVIKPMFVKGTTAPTKFKPYFEGIRDSIVTSIKSYDSNNNLIDTYTIPSAITSLDGYGRGINDNCYNVLDLEAKVFTDKDARGDLGTPTWQAAYGGFYTYGFTGYAYQEGTIKFLCSKYNEYNYSGSLSDFLSHDKSITFTANNSVWVKDSSYDNPSDFKTASLGVKLQYEKATYTTTNVSQYITDNVIEVEAGGYLVFENQYQQAVPSDITYRIEVES